MRKYVFVLAALLALAALAVGVSVALANEGPHGDYSITTGACASCHRIHTGLNGELLKRSTVSELCLACHGAAGVGAQTNVYEGRWRTSPGGLIRLNGGGFGSMPWLTGMTGDWTWPYQPVPGQASSLGQYGYPPTTQTTEDVSQFGSLFWVDKSVNPYSRHEVEDIEGVGTASGDGVAWGGSSSASGYEGTLECTSCHNPHGSTNYRLLRDTRNGYPYTLAGSSLNQHKWAYTAATSTSNETLWWGWKMDANGVITVADAQVIPTAEEGLNVGGTKVYSAGFKANYTEGMRNFCSTCHKSYLTKSSPTKPSTTALTPGFALTGPYLFPGSQDINPTNGLDNDPIVVYRHSTDMTRSTGNWGGAQPLRFAATDGNTGVQENGGPGGVGITRPELTCLTCHFAHGSAAEAATDISGELIGPANLNDGTNANNGMFYYDNRGVCRSCHQTDKYPGAPRKNQ